MWNCDKLGVIAKVLVCIVENYFSFATGFTEKIDRGQILWGKNSTERL